MGKTIIITEKPSVAQEYKKVLQVNGGKNDGYIEGHSNVINCDVIITWAVGHLIAIAEPKEYNEKWEKWDKANLPMIPHPFKYVPLKNTSAQFKVIKSLYTRPDIDRIYYAGDSGREGIYIQALIRNQIFRSKPNIDERVVWIDSYTAESIINGIRDAKPYSSYQNMIDSGYMRAISDWLIGMNFTECFTLTSGGYGSVLNVGRVMTPTLAMIVNRQDEIDHFKKTYYYGIKADNFATWHVDKRSRYFEDDRLYNETGFLKKEDAVTLATEFNQNRNLTVENLKVKPKTEYAPYLFNLADLQAFCSKRFHISPADTLKIAQSLYEKKYTTYPRTDSRFLTNAVASDLREKGYNIPARYIDDSKVTDHYALIPTFEGNADELQGLEQAVYKAIMKRFTDIMLPPYIYDAVYVLYVHSNGEHFIERYRIVKQYGFKAKNENDGEEQEEDKEELTEKNYVPNIGDNVSVNQFSVNEMETKPPVAYTTGSLILAMEKAGKLIENEELREQIKTSGIGTSATRASIIEKLKDKGFITVAKSQKIAPTELGKSIIPVIAKYDEALISPLKTADMENNLSAIADGEMSKDDYLNNIIAYVTETTNRVLMENKAVIASPKEKENKPKKEHKCPICGSTLKYGRYGFYCDCKFSFNNEICKAKMTESDLEDLLTNGRTKDKPFVSKNGRKFVAYLVVDKEKHGTTFVFANPK